MKSLLHISAAALLALAVISCDKNDDDDYHQPEPPANDKVSISLAAGDTNALKATLASFRAVLGEPVNGAPGAGGRREVNWDGVPANFTNNNAFPIDFFNNTDPAGPAGRKRGLQYAAGSVLRLDSTDFSELEASNADQFEAFTRKRIITSVGTNVSDIEFRFPGTTTPASVSSFGVVLLDVDGASSTIVEAYDGNTLLATAKPQAANGQFSFVGIRALNGNKITRIKIKAGNSAIAPGVKDVSAGGQYDLVAIDDLIYADPVALN